MRASVKTADKRFQDGGQTRKATERQAQVITVTREKTTAEQVGESVVGATVLGAGGLYAAHRMFTGIAPRVVNTVAAQGLGTVPGSGGALVATPRLMAAPAERLLGRAAGSLSLARPNANLLVRMQGAMFDSLARAVAAPFTSTYRMAEYTFGTMLPSAARGLFRANQLLLTGPTATQVAARAAASAGQVSAAATRQTLSFGMRVLNRFASGIVARLI